MDRGLQRTSGWRFELKFLFYGGIPMGPRSSTAAKLVEKNSAQTSSTRTRRQRCQRSVFAPLKEECLTVWGRIIRLITLSIPLTHERGSLTPSPRLIRDDLRLEFYRFPFLTYLPFLYFLLACMSSLFLVYEQFYIIIIII